ncbi:MAG: HU family DNA-binding protein [Nitrospirae bacterium]|nr:HU family DNA-binding protein [Nitrospirota bacterium]
MGKLLDLAGILVKGISIAIEDAKKQEYQQPVVQASTTEELKPTVTVIEKDEPSNGESPTTKPSNKDIILAFTDLAKSELSANAKFKIRGFGVFVIKDQQARKARNPKTGEIVDVPARKAVKFKMGSDLDTLFNKADVE